MLEEWRRLMGPDGAALVEAAARVDKPRDAASIAALRRLGTPQRVRCALELAAARRRAAEKFEHPERLVADAAGVEQATSLDVARHKARRFAERGVDTVLDLCCGIGGDAMGLGETARVVAVDADPVRAWMAHRNAGAPAAAADVTTLRLDGRPIHLDPSRRADGRRLWRYEDCMPGPAFIERVARGDASVKLSPGVAFEALPPGEVEIIQRRGSLVQAVLWTGRLRRHERSATRIDDGATIDGAPDQPIPTDDPRRYLFAVEPAVERAGLIGELCRRAALPAIHPALGLLTGPRLVEGPWLTPFELLASMPWRPRRVRAWLADHDAGIVEVKTRGRAADADAAQRGLRGTGARPYTVFVLRWGSRVSAMIARRLGPPRDAAR